MTDLAVTAANVLASGRATTERGVAGVAVTAGQTVYKEAASGTYKLTDSDSATAEANHVYGIALHSAGLGQPLVIVRDDPAFTPGATVVKGTTYWMSETPGGIEPAADLTAGEHLCLVGIGISTTQIMLKIVDTGVTL